ncbi:MAG: hypothetical protein AAGG48_31160 [Planctomycetota bacterium]
MSIVTRESICLGDTSALPKELVDFARRQVVNAILYKGDERRREERQPMMVPVRAVVVDENNQAIDRPFDLITRDVSSNTIGLIYTDPMEAERMVVEFSIAGTKVILATETIWSGPLGPFYGCAGRYIDRLTEFPEYDPAR